MKVPTTVFILRSILALWAASVISFFVGRELALLIHGKSAADILETLIAFI